MRVLALHAQHARAFGPCRSFGRFAVALLTFLNCKWWKFDHSDVSCGQNSRHLQISAPIVPARAFRPRLASVKPQVGTIWKSRVASFRFWIAIWVGEKLPMAAVLAISARAMVKTPTIRKYQALLSSREFFTRSPSLQNPGRGSVVKRGRALVGPSRCLGERKIANSNGFDHFASGVRTNSWTVWSGQESVCTAKTQRTKPSAC